MKLLKVLILCCLFISISCDKKEKTDPQSVVNKTMLFYPEASEHPNSEKPPQMQGAYLREPQLAFQAYSQQHYGYCIRTGVKIPFNPQLPMSTTAYEIWQRFENQHYPEFYCHFTGEDSFGQTSFGQPILKKNRMHAFTYLKGIE